MFSTFPAGLPGSGLLLLRATLGITAAVQNAIHLSEKSAPDFWMTSSAISGVICGVLLLVGFLTPIAGLCFFTVSLIGAFISFPDPVQLSIYEIILSAAVVLLGPGAYSLDARAFGRREIIIPKN